MQNEIPLNNFSSLSRKSKLEKLSNETYDLLVIGGGITGAGIALDAQSRGLKTALIEMQDFAGGTSSRSTKLIHGGLRYLKQFEFKLVAEVGRERSVVYNLALHVTRPEKMLLPIQKNGSIGTLAAYLGVGLYDFLAGVRGGEKRKYLPKNKTLIAEPLLKYKNLKGGIIYYEYRTDDARLTLEILKKANDLGVVALNYVKADQFLQNNGKITSVSVFDHNGEKILIKADNIINATGPWVDQVDLLNNTNHQEKLILTKGVHIIVDQSKFPLQQSVYFDVSDNRMVFAIPRANKVYIGTTDTFYSGNLENPGITREDKTYLLEAVNSNFEISNLTYSDIESGWAGLRPLIKQVGKSASSISRKDEIFEYPSGLISIAGGKLTGYRKMAEKVVDLVVGRIKSRKNIQFPKCNTRKIKLSGGLFESEEDFRKKIDQYVRELQSINIPFDEANILSERYGSNIPVLLKLFADTNKFSTDLSISLQLQILYSINFESALTISDFFIRRTAYLYFDIHLVEKNKHIVADFMGSVFNWTSEVKAKNISDLDYQINISKGLI